MHVLGADPAAFPPVDEADEDGVLAVGGDLSTERLINAYRRGIFPWYSEGLPILWHCPHPRFALPTTKLHVPKSLRKVMKRGVYEVRLDSDFEGVIAGCAETKRPGQRGTWITRDMRRAYQRLFDLGVVHTAETWADGKLVGGLYGVCLGSVFFGESMFARADDASKVAFITLVEWMAGWGVDLIDCQQETEHLRRFGAEPMPREDFVAALNEKAALPTWQGRWSLSATAPWKT